jgi:hypothetical protein
MTGPGDNELPDGLHEEDEALGVPSFELLVRHGEPIVSGSYFLHPPLRAVRAEWDAADPTRLNVRADDGSDWYAQDVPRAGLVNVVLQPVGDHPALKQARAVADLAAEADG